jgi:small subunit ribosomal protein S1
MISDDNHDQHEATFAELLQQNPEQRVSRRRFSKGDELEVVVVKVTNDALFVDLGSKSEGFIDAGDLSDGKGTRLQIPNGARVLAKVAEIGGRAGGIRLAPLTIRFPSADAENGEQVIDLRGGSQKSLATGATIKGPVVRIENYGIFIQIDAGSEGNRGTRGLVHLQESGLPRGADIRKHYTMGQEVEAKVIGIDPTGKVKLSIKALASDEEKAAFEKFEGASKAPAAPAAAAEKRPAEKQSPRSFGTLGDLLSKAGAKAAKPKR